MDGFGKWITLLECLQIKRYSALALSPPSNRANRLVTLAITSEIVTTTNACVGRSNAPDSVFDKAGKKVGHPASENSRVRSCRPPTGEPLIIPRRSQLLNVWRSIPTTSPAHAMLFCA
jgi:hypothetical protein